MSLLHQVRDMIVLRALRDEKRRIESRARESHTMQFTALREICAQSVQDRRARVRPFRRCVGARTAMLSELIHGFEPPGELVAPPRP